jgi:hypothetical protein
MTWLPMTFHTEEFLPFSLQHLINGYAPLYRLTTPLEDAVVQPAGDCPARQSSMPLAEIPSTARLAIQYSSRPIPIV